MNDIASTNGESLSKFWITVNGGNAINLQVKVISDTVIADVLRIEEY